MAIPARGSDRDPRLQAAGGVAAGPAAGRQGAHPQQGGRQPGLVERENVRKSMIIHIYVKT